MDITKISAGRNPPIDLHAVIEIPVGGVPVKYELDKSSSAMFVDRFLHTAMFYDLPLIMREQIAHFFQHYKDLEKGKWTTIGQWVDVEGSHRLIMDSITRAARQG